MRNFGRTVPIENVHATPRPNGFSRNALRAFVPAKVFEAIQRFYAELACPGPGGPDLAEVTFGEGSFLSRTTRAAGG